MKKTLLFFILFLISGFLFANNNKTKSVEFSLEKRWASEKIFKTPESVWYDKKTDSLYVSNINRYPAKNYFNGFISKLSPEGRIIKLKWVKGLEDPKGICTYKNKLYVSDIDVLVEVELMTGKIINKHKIKGVKFLNDVIADSKGRIYISDTSKNNSVIYRYDKGKIKVWLKGKKISKPNGLYYYRSILYIGNSGDKSIKMFNVNTKKYMGKIFVGTGIDGLVYFKKGRFLTSDWEGRTFLITKDGDVRKLLDTRAKKINSADIGFVPEKNLIIIPTFYKDRVVAYKLKER
jgi:DNA-binding beta-propeller fold protein YncE